MTNPMTFGSVDEAMEYLADPELVNMLKLALKLGRGRENPETISKMRTALDFITSGELRKQLERQFAETGKIEFKYSPSAFDYLKRHA